MKINKDLVGENHPSIIKIANHLIETSKKDNLIKNTLDKQNKSLKGMYSYVTSEAKKKAVNGSAMIEDAEVFGWAQHYYDEDSIDFEPKNERKTSKQPVYEVELPEEDIDVFDF